MVVDVIRSAFERRLRPNRIYWGYSRDPDESKSQEYFESLRSEEEILAAESDFLDSLIWLESDAFLYFIPIFMIGSTKNSCGTGKVHEFVVAFLSGGIDNSDDISSWSSNPTRFFSQMSVEELDSVEKWLFPVVEGSDLSGTCPIDDEKYSCRKALEFYKIRQEIERL